MAEKPWELYKYDLELSIEVAGKIMPIQTMQIHRLLIEKDYDRNILPIMLLDLNLPIDWYYRILENKLNTKFILKIYKYKQVADGIYNGKSLCISDKFIPIIEDDTPFMDRKMYEKIKYSSGFKENEIALNDFQYNYTFILVREDDLLCSKKVINTVIESCNLTTAIAHCLNKAGVKKALMSKLDNTSSYSEFLLLPIPLANQLNYINSFYGLYKNGAQIFFDFDCLYILNNTATCTAWRAQEIKKVTFDIDSPTSGTTLMNGSYTDTKEKNIYIKIHKDELELLNMGVSTDHIDGANTLYINTDQGSGTTIVGATQQFGNGSTNVKMSTAPNPYIASEMELRTKEKSGVFNITTTNIDIMTITPNKEFKMATTLTEIVDKVKGKYRLASYSIRFTKTGSKFDAICSIGIRKTDNS